MDKYSEDSRDFIQNKDSDHELDENAEDDTDVEEEDLEQTGTTEDIVETVKQESGTGDEVDISNEKIYSNKDMKGAKITSTRKSKRVSRVPVKLRDSVKRKSTSVTKVGKSKRPRKSATTISVNEDETSENHDSVPDTGKVKKEKSLSSKFYKELETLPQIKHYSEKLTDEDIKLEKDDDGFCLAIKDVDANGYSMALSAYYCKDCEYVFPEQKYFANHKRGGKCNFSCHFCEEPFSFRNFSEYQEHLRTHR